ncbi:hypothetical protein PG997_013316 [Apiospora hydei]|uniref:Uncharacterized protein n=1 Tax=Apiospora hydei TaxID=1337664 RepID=A0ABR1V5T3_9PEZI
MSSKLTSSMSAERCLSISDITIMYWAQQQQEPETIGCTQPALRRQLKSQEFHEDTLHDSCWFSRDSSMCILFASASRMRGCERCRHTLQKTFGIPDLWWTDHCKSSNGYFGCEVKRDAAGLLSINTWAYFEMKLVGQAAQYEWLKVNIFTHWVASSNQLSVLVFDAHPSLSERIATSFPPLETEYRRDPFWAYTKLMDEVVRIEDVAVMAIRDYVRAVEKEAPQEKPEPPYRFLHDISRHAVHVTETLDVAIETMDGMLSLHESVNAQVGNDDGWQTVHGHLLFSQQLLKGLRWRSKANERRLQNEIQLAFHMVTQYDSGVSVAIGKAAKEDSAAMKTVSMLTLAFLPATFISSIFSMSFFKFDTDTGWTVSNNFWIYWAWAVPTTLITSALWYYWQKQRVPGRSQTEEGRGRERQSLSLGV